MTLPPNIWGAYWSEAKPGTEAALERVVAELSRTPTAFNWTPALSAVFPARLTMSQLLAIWEAMHEAAVYEPLGSKASAEPVADVDGWIAHDGSSRPVSGETMVDVMFHGGCVEHNTAARFWAWQRVTTARWLTSDITHWRPAK